MVEHVFGFKASKSGVPSFGDLEGIPVLVYADADVSVERDSYDKNGI